MIDTTTIFILVGLVVVICLALRSNSEAFRVQTVPRSADPYAAAPSTLSETKMENELASVIDSDAPQLNQSTSLKTVVVQSWQVKEVVQTVLRRLNNQTDFDFHLVDITNASKQISSNGTQYLSMITKCHDMKRIFLREIALDVSIPISGRVFVRDVYFTNSAPDTSGIQGISSIDSLQTYAAFPSPLDDEW